MIGVNIEESLLPGCLSIDSNTPAGTQARLVREFCQQSELVAVTMIFSARISSAVGDDVQFTRSVHALRRRG